MASCDHSSVASVHTATTRSPPLLLGHQAALGLPLDLRDLLLVPGEDRLGGRDHDVVLRDGDAGPGRGAGTRAARWCRAPTRRRRRTRRRAGRSGRRARAWSSHGRSRAARSKPSCTASSSRRSSTASRSRRRGGRISSPRRNSIGCCSETFDCFDSSTQAPPAPRSRTAAGPSAARHDLGVVSARSGAVREEVRTEHHVLRRRREQRPFAGEMLLRRQHQDRASACASAERQVHGHLVAVEVRVERVADRCTWIALPITTQAERLDAQAVERRRATAPRCSAITSSRTSQTSGYRLDVLLRRLDVLDGLALDEPTP